MHRAFYKFKLHIIWILKNHKFNLTFTNKPSKIRFQNNNTYILVSGYLILLHCSKSKVKFRFFCQVFSRNILIKIKFKEKQKIIPTSQRNFSNQPKWEIEIPQRKPSKTEWTPLLLLKSQSSIISHLCLLQISLFFFFFFFAAQKTLFFFFGIVSGCLCERNQIQAGRDKLQNWDTVSWMETNTELRGYGENGIDEKKLGK